jgi:hypothetical protein
MPSRSSPDYEVDVVPKSRYFLSFLIATGLFAIVFLAAYSVSYINYTEVSKESNLIEQYVSDLDSILNEKSCSDSLLFEASEKLDIIGAKLNLLETRFGKDDKRVIAQKNLYSELEYKHFQIVQSLRDNCNAKFLTILFFYSNLENDKSESERVGFILSSLKNKAPGEVMIYSFDYNIDSGLLDKIKEEYGVSKAPSVLVNEKDFVDVANINDLEIYL